MWTHWSRATWVTIANFDKQESAMDRVGGVLDELKNLYRYGK